MEKSAKANLLSFALENLLPSWGESETVFFGENILVIFFNISVSTRRGNDSPRGLFLLQTTAGLEEPAEHPSLPHGHRQGIEHYPKRQSGVWRLRERNKQMHLANVSECLREPGPALEQKTLT